MSELRIKLLHPAAKAPTRATDFDIGLDLYGVENVTLWPGRTVVVSTGIAVQFYPWASWASLEIWPRSGLSSRSLMTHRELLRPMADPGAGLVDPGYTGEIRVVIHNLGESAYQLKAGDRVAQLKVAPVNRPHVVVVETLDATERGAAGFGSSGL
jgi:dUTP pyrophosphatase